MPRTKKPTTADLPITTETAKPARAARLKKAKTTAAALDRGDYSSLSDNDLKAFDAAVEACILPKRASRSQAAVAARKIAVDNRKAARALTQNDTVVAHAVAQIGAAVTGPSFKAAMADLDRDVRNELLDDEIDKAVAALDFGNEDREVVRSLADVDVGNDPFAVAQPGIEEAALARLNARIAAIEVQPGKFVDHLAGYSIADRLADMNDDPALPMIEKEYALDENCADGSTFVVVGSQAVIDLIDGFLPDEDTRYDALQIRLAAAKLAVAEREVTAQTGHLISDEDYQTMTALHDEVLDLQGQLKDALAAGGRDIAAMRHDLDVADIARHSAEALTKDSLEDLGQKRAIIEHLDAQLTGARKYIQDNAELTISVSKERAELANKVSGLEIQLSREQAANKILNSKLLAVFKRGVVARLLNRAA